MRTRTLGSRECIRAICLLLALVLTSVVQSPNEPQTLRGVIHQIDLVDNSLSVKENGSVIVVTVDSATVFTGKESLADFFAGNTVITILPTAENETPARADATNPVR